MDNALLDKLFVIASAIVVPIIVQWFTRKLTKADLKASHEETESSTAKNISEAANATVETVQNAMELFNNSIVVPLREAQKKMELDITSLKIDNISLKKDNEELRIEMAALKLDNSRKTLTITYLVEQIKETFPTQVEYARKILSGEVKYETTILPNSKTS